MINKNAELPGLRFNDLTKTFSGIRKPEISPSVSINYSHSYSLEYQQAE